MVSNPTGWPGDICPFDETEDEMSDTSDELDPDVMTYLEGRYGAEHVMYDGVKASDEWYLIETPAVLHKLSRSHEADTGWWVQAHTLYDEWRSDESRGGDFDTLSEACAAADEAALELLGETREVLT